jgi:predicted transcriptional regulator
MTVIELKEKLIEDILKADDEQLLDHISDLLSFEKSETAVHTMSDEEIEAVKDGLTQLERGEWLTNEEANKLADEWPKK